MRKIIERISDSPKLLYLISLVILVKFEYLILYIVNSKYPIDDEMENIYGPIILFIILLPLLYILLVLPLEKKIRELRVEKLESNRINLELDKLNDELEAELKEIRELRKIIPICAQCKSIRDDAGYWNSVESYMREHKGIMFSHTICDKCLKDYNFEI